MQKYKTIMSFSKIGTKNTKVLQLVASLTESLELTQCYKKLLAQESNLQSTVNWPWLKEIPDLELLGFSFFF